MGKLVLGALGLFGVQSAMAQTFMAASLPQALSLQVDNYPVVVSNAGPIPASGLVLTAGSGLDASTLRIDPLQFTNPNASGWRITAFLATTGGPQPGYTALAGALQLTLIAPQVTSGILVLMPAPPNTFSGTGDLTVDVNGDGLPDYFAITAQHTELPLTIGPSGVVLGVGATMSITSPPTTTSQMARGWHIMFVPDVYGMRRHAGGCDTLRSTRLLPSLDPVIIASTTAQAPIAGAWLLVGLNPTNVTIPFAPFCQQLVDYPVFVAPDGPPYSPWSRRWTLPAMPLPPGVEVYVQSVWYSVQGVFGTDSYRTF